MHRILQNYVWLYFMKDKLIDHVSDAAEMPKDVALKAPILTLTGRTELTIENYRGSYQAPPVRHLVVHHLEHTFQHLQLGKQY